MKKIIFFSSVAGVSELFPVLPAKDFLPKWLQTARIEHMKGDKRDQTIVRCPGIIDVLTTGYVVTTWHDFDVTITDDKISLIIPDKALTELLNKDSLQIQSSDGMAKHIPKRPWSQHSILKLNTPYQIIAPKGVRFLMIPLPYTDSFNFESNIGILDPAFSSELNVQGYLNFGKGTHHFKAGTPIAQIIPMTNENFEMICRDMTPEDERWLKKRSFLNNFSFVFNRNKVKDVYNNYVKSISKCPFHFK
jgi:hypothetical protein